MEISLAQRSSRPVAIWLLIGVGMIIIQILLGGITRLTGSGLSITEWNIITGALPPTSEQQWLTEFQKYQHTPQYQLINFDFTLRDFKFIFFWEWVHRLWARLIGIVFLIPFLIFLVQRRFKPAMVKPMLILFLLGALQGAVGWIMVASGLTGDAIYVNPVRLALHFIMALALLCYTFWFALELLIPAEKISFNTSLRRFTWVIVVLLIVQLLFGALMAGHKAANAAYTWPDINGSYIPPNMFAAPGRIANVIKNKITIHFIHRNLGYVLFVLIIAWSIRAFRLKGSLLLQKTKSLPFLLVCLQVVLGIFTVLSSLSIVPNHWGTFEWMAQLHQLIAMCLLLSLIWMLYIIQNKRELDSV